MRYGVLSDYFTGIAAKRLSVVESDPKKSNQHELNGSEPLKRLLTLAEFYREPSLFIWLGEENEGISDTAWVSWYDSRKNNPNRAAEWRLYYPSNPVMELAQPGDLLIVARRPDRQIVLIVVPQGSTLENQLFWLFGLDGGLGREFQLEEFDGGNDRELDFAARYILDEIGVEIEEPDADRLDTLLERFDLKFPKTRDFSAFARDTLEGVSALDDPDAALLAWMTHEEALFRRLERHIVSERLSGGFMGADGADVDGFLQFSLSVQNRRKSRVGFALENHLEAVFAAHGVRFARGAQTEHRAKPDFLFPGAEEYQNPEFPADRLSMLGAKSTCKDRWRQVLSEAERIRLKHLLTLEPGISENQTQEMQANNLQLVVPAGVHKTYSEAQRGWLLGVADFMRLIRDKQSL